MFLLQKSIEISMVLVSPAAWEFELNLRHFVTRVVPQSFKFDLSSH